MKKDFKHGLNGYTNHGCRCDLCKADMAAYKTAYDATPVRKIAQAAYYAAYKATPACKASHARYRASTAGKIVQARYEAKRCTTPIGSLKRKARKAVSNALAAGTVIKQPCTACGKPKAEAHHADYHKPLKVEWLCTCCHRDLHLRLKARRITKQFGAQDVSRHRSAGVVRPCANKK